MTYNVFDGTLNLSQSNQFCAVLCTAVVHSQQVICLLLSVFVFVFLRLAASVCLRLSVFVCVFACMFLVCFEYGC